MTPSSGVPAGGEEILRELARYLPNNENLRRGDAIAAIRDLAQVAISERGNARVAESALAEKDRENAELRGKLETIKRLASRTPLCPDHRDKFWHLPCPACSKEQAEQRVATLEAALRQVADYLQHTCGVSSDTCEKCDVLAALKEKSQ